MIRMLAEEFGSERTRLGLTPGGGMIEGWKRPAGSYLAGAERFENLGAGAPHKNVDVEGLQGGTQPLRWRPPARTKVPAVAPGGDIEPADVRSPKYQRGRCTTGSALILVKATICILEAADEDKRSTDHEGDRYQPLSLDLDGSGAGTTETGIPFLTTC